MTIVIINGKQYEAELNEDGSYKAPPQLIPDPTPDPVRSKVKPLKAVINSLITLKDDGTYDFAEAMQFTSWLESTWARKILEPIFAMSEADISKAEATMLTQFITGEVAMGNLPAPIAIKIGALLDSI